MVKKDIEYNVFSKCLTQMLFIDTPALQIRASPILERHQNKSSNKLQTIVKQIKTEPPF